MIKLFLAAMIAAIRLGLVPPLAGINTAPKFRQVRPRNLRAEKRSAHSDWTDFLGLCRESGVPLPEKTATGRERGATVRAVRTPWGIAVVPASPRNRPTSRLLTIPGTRRPRRRVVRRGNPTNYGVVGGTLPHPKGVRQEKWALRKQARACPPPLPEWAKEAKASQAAFEAACHEAKVARREAAYQAAVEVAKAPKPTPAPLRGVFVCAVQKGATLRTANEILAHLLRAKIRGNIGTLRTGGYRVRTTGVDQAVFLVVPERPRPRRSVRKPVVLGVRPATPTVPSGPGHAAFLEALSRKGEATSRKVATRRARRLAPRFERIEARDRARASRWFLENRRDQALAANQAAYTSVFGRSVYVELRP